MNFSLSDNTRRLIQQSTGLDYKNQCATAISGIKTAVKKNYDYMISEPRDVAPRGSIYLQMGRIMPLRKIKSYLKRI